MKQSTVAPDVIANEPRLYRVVASRIENFIRAYALQPGERLPSERDLAQRLGVSRTSLREGLLALELGGVVEVRGGSGIYVSEPTEPQVHPITGGAGPFEILAARRIVEGETAAKAARNANGAAIDAIRVTMEQMELCHDDRAMSEAADREFHVAIARATGNGAMVEVVRFLWNQRGALSHKLEEQFETEELRSLTHLDHRNIFAAIASRDIAGARAAMRAHLDRVTQTLSRGR